MIINGKFHSFENNITISDLLKNLNISSDLVVVEVNLNIVCKENFSDTVLNDSDRIEIISFVGGG